MKHLLTALIATVLLFLPLQADEPAQTVSVRVIDHEGGPVDGLGLTVTANALTHYGVTDDQGILNTELPLPAHDDAVVVNPQPSGFLRVPSPGGHIASFLTEHGSDPEKSRLFKRHIQQLESHAIAHTVQLSSKDLVDGVITIRLPEPAIRSIIIEFDGLSSWGTHGWWLQPEDGAVVTLAQRDASFVHDDSSMGLRYRVGATVAVPAGRSTPVGLYRLGQCFLIEDESENAPFATARFKVPDTFSGSVGIRFTRRSQDAAWSYFLVSANGQLGQLLGSHSLFLPAIEDKREHVARSWVPPGQYIAISTRTEDSSIPNLWSPGSVFDTMHRLRRGEDLPHLKRITIPEGATVELSSEDFLDPPADKPQPADPR